MKNELSAWEKEKKLIPVMIKKYCRGRHKQERKAQGVKGGDTCAECRELTEYALFRLEQCPFKVNKKFCSFCRIHCYKPDMREKIKAVMKYSGPRMIATHPIFALSHVVQMIKYKKRLKAEAEKK
ncbi:MAG: nitrous oxide-stimulated promoter family protein [Clostridia bacterium]|nr:nitrous oxide-stimulated promoter family protein [Clostridia bacterium]